MTNYRAFIDTDTVDFQALHHPTEPYNLRPTGEIRGGRVVRSRPEMVQRRKQDARIFKDMTPAQESAFELIYYGWRALSSDVIMKSGFDILRVDGGRRTIDPERTAEMASRYYAWAKACPENDVHVASVINVVCQVASLRASERLYRKRNGWAKPNLINGLELYIKMWGARG